MTSPHQAILPFSGRSALQSFQAQGYAASPVFSNALHELWSKHGNDQRDGRYGNFELVALPRITGPLFQSAQPHNPTEIFLLCNALANVLPIPSEDRVALRRGYTPPNGYVADYSLNPELYLRGRRRSVFEQAARRFAGTPLGDSCAAALACTKQNWPRLAFHFAHD